MTCLVANGDELWGLTPSVRPGLPPPPEPVPVTMSLAPGGVPEGFAAIAEKAFRQALRDYPLLSEAASEPTLGPGPTAEPALGPGPETASEPAVPSSATTDPAGAPLLATAAA
jgi:hypothetical protein